MDFSCPRRSNITSGVNITKTVVSVVQSRLTGFLNICHFNAQSINARNTGKMDEIRDLFSNSKFHIVLVSETWLKPYVSNASVQIPGYKIYRNDRPRITGGGVAIYVKNDIKCVVVAKSSDNPPSSANYGIYYQTSGVQFLFLEIFVNMKRLLVGVVYNPKPSIHGHRANLEAVFENLSTQYEDCVLLGDFNTNILRPNNDCVNFRNLLAEFGLRYYESNAPTHFPCGHLTSQPSCIDLVITNRIDGVMNFSQIDLPGVSKHDLIFFSYDVPMGEYHSPSYLTRGYRNLDVDTICAHIVCYPWDNFYNSGSIDDMLQIFNTFILMSFEQFVPVIEIIPKNKSNPWFNDVIRIAIQNRDRAYKLWKTSRSSLRWISFTQLRNRVNDLIKYAKRDYFNHYITSDLTTKKLWKRLKQHGISSPDNADIPFDLNSINSTFTSSASLISHQQSDAVISDHSSNINSSFSFRNVSIDELVPAIESVKSNSVGDDQIPIRFIKLILPAIAPFILHLFNHILTTSIFPSCWKIARVIPIPKTNFVRAMDDLRPISILPGLSKAFERIAQNQINDHLTLNNLLSASQSGFRKNFGTDTALLSIANDLISMLDENKIAILTLLDFSKAFDSVNREILARKLSEKFGFTSSAVELISNYLSERSQYVEANGRRSNTAVNYAGVPQGSILGPLLFSMFINDLPDVVRHCKCHMFADDVQLYLGRKSFAKEEMLSQLNSDLLKIVEWANTHKLLLNPSKSKCVIFALHNVEYHRSSLGRINILGENIEVCRYATNLGLTMDSGFTWNNHANNICGRIYGGLRCLKSSAIPLSLPIKIMLVKTLLLPHIIYCSPVMGNLHDNVFSKIQKSFYAALRFVYNVPRTTHMSEYAIRFLGCTLKTFLKYRTCLMLHKIISSRQPGYLYDTLRFGNSERLSRLMLARNRSRVKNDSFFVFGVSVYNEIPLSIRSIASFNTFKKSLFAFLCNN